MAHPYIVPATEPRFGGYAVTVGGEPVPVLPVRVSKVPFCRRWPGHQRSLDQTELAGMARLSVSGETRLEVVADRDFSNAVVRPLSKGAKIETAGRKITLAIPGPGHYSLELDGRHGNLHIFADPPEQNMVSGSNGVADPPEQNMVSGSNGGMVSGSGIRYFGPGVHEPGLITLKSGETLYIDEGAVVYGRIEARDADGIRILGRGILDASRVKAVPVRDDPARDAEDRAKGFEVANVERYDTIRLEFCDNVLIDGPTLRDAPLYTIRPVGCRNLEIRNVKIVGNWRYNSDGIDMHNCRHVRISDCFIRTFDDCLCVKGFDCWMDEADMLHDGEMHDVFDDVVVERCTTWCDWGRNYEIGAETRAREICGIVFRDCDAIYATHICCDVQNVDYAVVHDILFDDIRCEYDRHQPHIQTQRDDAERYDANPSEYCPARLMASVVWFAPEYSRGGLKRGVNRDVTFRNIQAFAPGMPPSEFRGHSAEGCVRDTIVDGLFLNGRRVASAAEANLRVGPFAEEPVFTGL